MKDIIGAVEHFHNTFGIENQHEPALIPEDQFILRHRLMKEENDEYIDACWQGDLPGIADALGDQLYILCGTLLKHGLQHKIEQVFWEIQRSNMSKLGPDGKPIYREDGKVLKGSGYTPPDIKSIINGE